ncbi:hypothetical protein MHTCC0001_36520 [Flavobacteriaceae bacterium MHTCC 0001]
MRPQGGLLGHQGGPQDPDHQDQDALLPVHPVHGGVRRRAPALEGQVLQDEEVLLRLEGPPPKGEGPGAVVPEGYRVLWQGEVVGLKEVRVRTTGRGVLVLAYHNDLYAPPEDRILFLRGLRVRSRPRWRGRGRSPRP